MGTRIRVIRFLTLPPVRPRGTVLDVVVVVVIMVAVVVVVLMFLLLEVAKHPAEDVSGFVQQHPEGKRVYQLQNKDLFDD